MVRKEQNNKETTVKKIIYSLGCVLALSSSFAMAQSDNSGPGGQPPGDRPAPPSFSDMDTNGDGVLTEDELKGPMQKDFSQIDADGDGSITESELNTFMSSHRPPERPDNN